MPWISSEILDKYKVRKELKGRWYESKEELERYAAANREVKKSVNKARDKWINAQCEEIEGNVKSNPRNS